VGVVNCTAHFSAVLAAFSFEYGDVENNYTTRTCFLKLRKFFITQDFVFLHS
jgi:hypothetical protein